MKEKELCIVCAWRATCQKQFSMKVGQKCPDYCKDLMLKDPSAATDGTTEVK